jgi:hypothetical protein
MHDLVTPTYALIVPCARQAGLLQRSGAVASSCKRKSKPLFEIKAIKDPGHPACGQHGLFAAANLPPRSHIIDYCGTERKLNAFIEREWNAVYAGVGVARLRPRIPRHHLHE